MFNKILPFTLALFFTAGAAASVKTVTVPQEMTVLTSDNSSSVLKIRSADKTEPTYIKASVFEVDESSIGTGKEILTPVEGELKKNGLVVQPEKFAMAPGGSSTVRLIYTGKEARQDRYFKIRFQPVLKYDLIGEAEKDEALDANLFFSITSTGFAVVPKKQPEYAHTVSSADFTTDITNVGDSLMLLQDCTVCVDSACISETEKRLTPGRTISLAGEPEVVADFKKENGKAPSGRWQCDLITPNGEDKMQVLQGKW
ncbi:hypothetical protein [Psychromonas ossibalaenae]|uniref:hypothetical protein n=1 Tax=Psychromonas ossibalaenae TaxID=444922 RepID=UPI00037D77FC|nr:hypothetical protein [Psychromonas ossibalaenae]